MITGHCHCGAVSFEFDGVPDDVTACSCTVCRRYGTLWAYDYEGEGIRITTRGSNTGVYIRGEKEISFNFCRTCGCVTHWRALQPNDKGRRRIAVNMRMAEPDVVAAIPVQRFDGLSTWDDLPKDGRCVADVWF